eukprot:4958747-Pleurochrysis_carterae.AAC.1
MPTLKTRPTPIPIPARTRRQTALCFLFERAHMRAVVEAPHARRLLEQAQARDDVFAVGSDADRVHVTSAAPSERAHLRASGEGATHGRAVSSAERNAALEADQKVKD